MNGYAVDTNIISFLMRGNLELQKKIYREANAVNGVIIPPIVYYEIKRGLKDHHASEKLAAFKRLCDMLGVGEIDIETLDKAADIYAELKKNGCLIEDSDILIAAFCLAHDYVLITDNTRHFERIDGLRFVNWAK